MLDLAVLGPVAWSYLGELCAQMPLLGVIVCTGPRRRRSAYEGCVWVPTTG